MDFFEIYVDKIGLPDIINIPNLCVVTKAHSQLTKDQHTPNTKSIFDLLLIAVMFQSVGW